MSGKVKEALFELIKSLSKSEKRYFKLQSSRHTIGDENNYVRLFDYLDKQVTYDEERIFADFKGEAFLNRFSITKKRLYDHILDALNAFYLEGSIDAQLYGMLNSADILYAKSLYEQTLRVLRSAEKLAEKHDRTLVILEVHKRTQKLIENTAYAGVSPEDIQNIFDERKDIIESCHRQNELWKIKSELFQLLASKGKPRTEEEVAIYEAIVNKMPKNRIKGKQPFDVQYLQNHILSAYYFAIGDIDRSYDHLVNNLNLFDDNEDKIRENLNIYFSLLTNAIYVFEKLGLQTETNNLLRKLKSIQLKYEEARSEDQQIKLFGSTTSIELSILTARADFNECLNQIPLYEKGLEVYGNRISPVRKAFIQFKIATVYLSAGDYSKALKWINTLLNEAEIDKNEDIYSFAQILDLLIHLELKHDQLLPYSLKNTQRFLKSRNRLHTFEKVFLHFISKRLKTNNSFEAEILWEDLFSDLSKIHEDYFESQVLENFDFQTWAEAKVKRIPFQELMRQKYLNHIIKKKSA